MLSPIISATIQSTIISLCSSVFATLYSNSTPPIIPLLVYTALSTPPNFLWQQYLENIFPGYTVDKRDSEDGEKNIRVKKKLNLRNTLAKFGLDQTIGALVNVVLFVGGVKFLRGFPAEECFQGIKEVCNFFCFKKN